MKYKVNPLITKKVTLINFHVYNRNPDKTLKGFFSAVKDTLYVTETEEDELIVNEMLKKKTKQTYSRQLENQLIELGLKKDIDYKINKGCRSCGGRGSTIEYSILMVVDDE